VNKPSGFKKAGMTDPEVHALLKKNNERTLYTGVRVIDDVFGGIKSSDIVLVGAATGIGKTELMVSIALNVARQGKQVYMFALEAEEREIEMRILFKEIAKTSPKRLVYKKWYANHYKELDYVKAIEELNLKNLHVYYRSKEFTVKDFSREVMLIKENADLIITDHVHYFDLQGENENRELSRTMKEIRDISLLTGVPNILVGHLRKENSYSGERRLVPEISDFHGSSDLSKICTKALILAQLKARGDLVPTVFHFPKFRQFGAVRNYVFVCPYDLTKNSYSDKYRMFYFKENSEDMFKTNPEEIDPSNVDWLG
jgi:replicative DNA helicase